MRAAPSAKPHALLCGRQAVDPIGIAAQPLRILCGGIERRRVLKNSYVPLAAAFRLETSACSRPAMDTFAPARPSARVGSAQLLSSASVRRHSDSMSPVRLMHAGESSGSISAPLVHSGHSVKNSGHFRS